MKFTTELKNGALIVTVNGRMDSIGANRFGGLLRESISDDLTALILDLQSLYYINSTGLRSIIIIAKAMEKRRTYFALCALSDSVKAILEAGGFDKIITIHPSWQTALAAVTIPDRERKYGG